MADSIAAKKIKRAYHKAIAAWWVLLVIAGYSIFAWRFLGTSCLIASTTGLPCPGCGGTRAMYALIKLDIKSSLLLHPMLMPSIAVMGTYAVLWLTHETMPRAMEIALVPFVISFIALYAFRLIFMFPRIPPMEYNRLAILPRLIRLILPNAGI